MTTTPTISLETYNKLVDQVNAGRGLVHYVVHLGYCPHAGKITLAEGVTILDVVRTQRTCNCGLTERVLEAFGEKP